jgi:putative ATP-binding cassette transporter
MKNFIKLITPFFHGSDKIYARVMGITLLLLSQLITAYGYFFIQWNRRFYDALESRQADLFYRESWVFAALAISYVLSYSLARYVGQQYALRWRIWMTENALGFWLNSKKMHNIEGSDQRIQEDLMRFTTIFERFFIDCFNAVLLIILFIPLLYTQTKTLYLININLCWLLLGAVIVYTIAGMFISAKIANPLIKIEYNTQKLEAEFRYNLVHVRDGKEVTPSLFKQMLRNITQNYNQSYNRQKYFNLWQKAYDQFSFLIPFMLMASNYFAGVMTLGMLMQIKSTFSRIRNSMAYILDNYPSLTEMLAIAQRLVEFYTAADNVAATNALQANNYKAKLHAVVPDVVT